MKLQVSRAKDKPISDGSKSCYAALEMLKIINGSHAIIEYGTVDQIAGDGLGIQAAQLPNSCRFFSHRAFSSAMNWMKSGVCLIRSKKRSRSKSG